jgi:hypothetical protein
MQGMPGSMASNGSRPGFLVVLAVLEPAENG